MIGLHNPKVYEGFIFERKNTNVNKYMVIDDVVHEIHRIVCFRFKLDADAGPSTAIEEIVRWLQSEVGKWITSKAVDSPEWHRHQDPMTYEVVYCITARLKGVDHTFWAMKWANQSY